MLTAAVLSWGCVRSAGRLTGGWNALSVTAMTCARGRRATARGGLILGRGLVGRWEVAFEVEPHARGRGLGRALAAAALGLLPVGTPVFAQVAPGNSISLRATLAAGYVPVAAEVLLPRDETGDVN